MSPSIEMVETDSINIQSLKMLFTECKWDWIEPDLEMLQAFKNSFRLFQAKIDGQVVGFGRVISDGKVYGLLVDVMVSPSLRGNGIGKLLIDDIVEQCRKDGFKVIQLLSSRLGKNLYLKSGFTQCPEASPGMIKFLAGDLTTAIHSHKKLRPRAGPI